jgi:hypothetical protein
LAALGLKRYHPIMGQLFEMSDTMNIPGKRVQRTRLVRTDRFVVAVEVEAIIPDVDPSEPCYEPQVVELLRQVEAHARAGDVDWLKQHGKVYTAMEAA